MLADFQFYSSVKSLLNRNVEAFTVGFPDDVVIVDEVKPVAPSPRKTRARTAQQNRPKSSSPGPEEPSVIKSKGTKRPTIKSKAPAKTNGAFIFVLDIVELSDTG